MASDRVLKDFSSDKAAIVGLSDVRGVNDGIVIMVFVNYQNDLELIERLLPYAGYFDKVFAW